MLESWIIASIVVLIATILQACTGFGFSILATPFLLLVYDAHDAIQINIILSLFISLFMIRKIGHEVDKRLLKKLIIGSIVGAPFGMLVFVYLDDRLFKIVIGILIILLTIILMMKFVVKQTERKDLVAGGFAGLFTTSMGMPGPPLLLYLSGAKIEKGVLRSTTLAFYLFIYFISIIMQIAVEGINEEIWLTLLTLIPFVFLGIYLGQLLFKVINQRIFQVMTYFILGFTGIYLLVQSF